MDTVNISVEIKNLDCDMNIDLLYFIQALSMMKSVVSMRFSEE